MSNTKPFVSLKGVSIRLDGGVLFEGLDWEIESDQHWAVVGPNGSGKSALMKVLAGELPATGGEIVYHFLKGKEAAHERIAYVAFEAQREVLGPEAYYQDRWNTGLAEEAPTVSDFLSEQSVQHVNRFAVVEEKPDVTFPKRREKVIRDTGLKPLLGRKLMELSNGERRKVSIARALLKNPRLLVLDNPFEGLDVKFRATLKKNLETLMRGDVRVIVVGTGREEIPEGITHVLRIGEDRTVSVGLRNEMMLDSSSANGRIGRYIDPTSHDARASRSGKILVQMKNVNVSYNKVPVLRRLSWTVREGEKWALFGPNGVGKTTLLSLILGDNPQAYANDITLFGKRRGSGESIWEIKKNIGWVSPELQLYYPAEATCLDVVCAGFFDTVGLYRAPSPRQEKIARSWLKKFGLAKQAATVFEDVSEGEGRLVLLARALVKDPALLILDEPVAGLDTANRDRVLKAIDAAAKRSKMSTIYVTHRMDELPSSITHTLKLEKRA